MRADILRSKDLHIKEIGEASQEELDQITEYAAAAEEASEISVEFTSEFSSRYNKHLKKLLNAIMKQDASRIQEILSNPNYELVPIVVKLQHIIERLKFPYGIICDATMIYHSLIIGASPLSEPDTEKVRAFHDSVSLAMLNLTETEKITNMLRTILICSEVVTTHGNEYRRNNKWATYTGAD
jgi:hypothetical protein